VSYQCDLLEAVDWHPLVEGYEPSVDVPQLLRGIWSRDTKVRRRAYGILADVVSHDHERCEATAAVASVLIDLVADPEAPDRFAACQILTGIVIGDETTQLTNPPNWTEIRLRVDRQARMTKEELLQEKAAWAAAAPTEQERKAREWRAHWADVERERDAARWTVHAYDTVRAAVPVYTSALQAPDPATRQYAAYLLAWLREDRETIAPAFERLLEREEDPVVGASACVAAGLCCGTDGGDGLIDRVRARRRSDDRVERWSAVLGLARLMANPDRSIIEELYDCLATAGGPYPHWPFLDGDLTTMAAITMSQLPSRAAHDRVDILIDRLTAAGPEDDQFLLLRALLDAAFPGGPIADGTVFTELDGQQRKAVLWLWQTAAPTKGAMICMLLAKYNLPDKQQELDAWCGLDLR
jgi:hypothetical protein